MMCVSSTQTILFIVSVAAIIITTKLIVSATVPDHSKRACELMTIVATMLAWMIVIINWVICWAAT